VVFVRATTRMKLRDSPVCETCPYNTTESLQHFLLECPAYKNIRDQSFQEMADHMNVFLIGETCYFFNQECGDYFDRIGKTMLKRMYVFRTSVLNIDVTSIKRKINIMVGNLNSHVESNCSMTVSFH
jgi:hypothetical protein